MKYHLNHSYILIQQFLNQILHQCLILHQFHIPYNLHCYKNYLRKMIQLIHHFQMKSSYIFLIFFQNFYLILVLMFFPLSPFHSFFFHLSPFHSLFFPLSSFHSLFFPLSPFHSFFFPLSPFHFLFFHLSSFPFLSFYLFPFHFLSFHLSSFPFLSFYLFPFPFLS